MECCRSAKKDGECEGEGWTQETFQNKKATPILAVKMQYE